MNAKKFLTILLKRKIDIFSFYFKNRKVPGKFERHIMDYKITKDWNSGKQRFSNSQMSMILRICRKVEICAATDNATDRKTNRMM